MEKLQKYSIKDFFLTYFSVRSEKQKGSSGHFCNLKVSVVSNSVAAHELSRKYAFSSGWHWPAYHQTNATRLWCIFL